MKPLLSDMQPLPACGATDPLRSLVRGKLAALPTVAMRHGVLLLVAFGSTVRGRRRAGSDLDLAVLFLGPPQDETWLSEEAELAWELERVLKPVCELDLVVLNRASAPMQKAVADEGVVLYADEPNRWSLFRLRARRNYEDTEKYRRRRWEVLLKRYGPQRHEPTVAEQAEPAG
jgi:predicted nucleotidyltransferase